MLSAAVIPERNRTIAPPETACEFRPVCMLAKIIEQRLAFSLGHVFKCNARLTIHLERLATCLRMRAKDWVVRGRFPPFGAVLRLSVRLGKVTCGSSNTTIGMHRPNAME